MLRKSYAFALVTSLIAQTALAGIFELGQTKRTLDGFPVVATAEVSGRHGGYTLKDWAAGEVQVKVLGSWRKALNAQILLETPTPFGGDIDKAVQILGTANAAGLRLRAAIAAPSSLLAGAFEKAKVRFPELNTEKKEMDKLIAEIRKHGSRSIYEINLFVERESSTIFAEYSSKSGSNIQTTTAEIDATDKFFATLISMWGSNSNTAKSKMKIVFK